MCRQTDRPRVVCLCKNVVVALTDISLNNEDAYSASKDTSHG
jgi:hypothetical protein